MGLIEFDNEQEQAEYEAAMEPIVQRAAMAIIARDDEGRDFYLSPEMDYNKWKASQVCENR